MLKILSALDIKKCVKSPVRLNTFLLLFFLIIIIIYLSLSGHAWQGCHGRQPLKNSSHSFVSLTKERGRRHLFYGPYVAC